MSKTVNHNIEKIESMQVEKVVGGEIHLKIPYFKCVNCGSLSVRRSVSKYTLKSRKTSADPKFDCRICGHKSSKIHSEKHGKDMEFVEYREILKEEI